MYTLIRTWSVVGVEALWASSLDYPPLPPAPNRNSYMGTSRCLAFCQNIEQIGSHASGTCHAEVRTAEVSHRRLRLCHAPAEVSHRRLRLCHTPAG
eukprot:3114901-Pyramimonas_sp.AAC.1